MVLRSNPPSADRAATESSGERGMRDVRAPPSAKKATPLPVPVGQHSALAQWLEKLRFSDVADTRVEASLADVIDDALRSMHHSSVRQLPDPKTLMEGLPASHRQETLLWLLQAFDVMGFPDNLLFDTAMVLDRYYATIPREEGAFGAQRKLLAAVCTTLKTSWPVECLQLPLREMVGHLGRDQVPFDHVMRAELAVLKALKFQVGTPTARDFLEAFSARLATNPVAAGGSAAWISLAEFLLQLTLVDATLHFAYPHTILAVSVLTLSLWTLRAGGAAFEILYEDFAVSDPDPTGSASSIVQCMAAVHNLWVRSVSPGHEDSPYAQHLCVKFGRVNRHSVATIAPPSNPPSHLPLDIASQIWIPSRAQRRVPGLSDANGRDLARMRQQAPQTQEQRRIRRAASWCGSRSTRPAVSRSGGTPPP